MIIFEEENPYSNIWWTKSQETGEARFIFDRKKTCSVWKDYPCKMTPEGEQALIREILGVKFLLVQEGKAVNVI